MGFHAVVLAAGESDGVGGDVGSFDADHGEPAIRAHVWQGCGEGGPWIPDDGGFGFGFIDGNAAPEDGIVDVHGDKGVEIGPIGFASQFEERVSLAFPFEVVDFVEVFRIGKADDGDLLGVAD